MASEEVGGIVFLVGYGAMLVGAIKIFGLRRVVMTLLLIVVLAIATAFKTLAVVTGSRRY